MAIVKTGKNLLLDRLYQDVAKITDMGFGNDDTAVTTNDTDLGNEVDVHSPNTSKRDTINVVKVSDQVRRVEATIPEDDTGSTSTITLKEVGIFTDSKKNNAIIPTIFIESPPV